jgi:hypothetical protein
MANAYLAQFGRLAFVGRFEAAADAVGSFARGDRVVVRGPRGLELATVMGEAIERFYCDPAEGELLRSASFDDFAAAERSEALGQRLLAAAEVADLPITFIDSEVSLDGTAAVLHGLPWGDCDASPLFASLSEQFGLAVRLLDLSTAPTAKDAVETGGCGKPGCGSESRGGCSSCSTGGCSTGSCSSGKVKSAGELTAYFADLRQKMEGMARHPLV